ncbi:MAG: LamG domain-containing protein, partial [Planctomycetota bacterium]
FGDNAADVQDGTGGTFRGNQTTQMFLVGLAGSPYPEGLARGTTYYWRIDEVEADGATIRRGQVWSFTVVGPTARHPSPPDAGRFVDLDVELSWSPGFGAIMHHVYFGENFADVNAGTPDTYKGIVAATTYTPGSLALNTTYYWRIDEFDAADTHKGDIWRFATRPVIPIFDPNLVGWWKLDDEGTGTVIDYSGYDRDGTIHSDPQFVTGVDGGALEFDGDDYVTIDGYKGIISDGTETSPFSIAVWIRKVDVGGEDGGDGEIIGWGNTGGGNRMEIRFNAGNNRIRIECGGGNVQIDTAYPAGEWHHFAITVDSNSTYAEGVNFYYDGVLNNRGSTDTSPIHPTSNFDVIFGQRYNRANERWFTGALDDVRLYDKVLTVEEVGRAMQGDPRLAWAPRPDDESEPFIEEATPLIWTPGDSAVQHDVYLGVSEIAVADADISDTTGIYRGRQDANSYNPPETLEFSETYYWRIDEVEADGTTTFRGRVWSLVIANFIVVDNIEDYNDYQPDTIFDAWKDGYDDQTNGSVIGHLDPQFALDEHYVETTIVHGGDQSMPYSYNNASGYSEATMTLSSARDWTKHGVKALSLWHIGYPASVGRFTEEPAGTYKVAARTVGNIADESDEFHFAFRQLNGAGSIIAKVEWVRDADDNAQAGVMIRDTLDPNSAHAAMLLETNDIAADWDLLFRRRETVGVAGTTTTVDETYVYRLGGGKRERWCHVRGRIFQRPNHRRRRAVDEPGCRHTQQRSRTDVCGHCQQWRHACGGVSR